MTRIQKQIYFTILWVLYWNLLLRYFVSEDFLGYEYLQLVPDVIIFSLFVKSYKTFKLRKLRFALGRELLYIYVSIWILGIVSALVHNVSFLAMLWGIRLTFRFALFFVLILSTFKMKDVCKMKKWLYNSYYICLFFCLLQFSQGQTHDFMGGIFGGNGELALFTILITIMSIGDYLQRTMDKRHIIIVLVGYMFVAILAEIKLLYFIFPIISYGVYVLMKRFSLKHVFVLLLAFFFLIPAYQTVMALYYDEEYIEKTFDEEAIDEETHGSYGFKKGGFQRNTAIPMATEVIIPKSPELYIGHGIGAGSASKTFGGKLYEKYKNTTYHFFSTSYVLVELGWIGLILFAICIGLLSYRFIRFYFKNRDPFIKYWSACGFITSIITYIMAWYNHEPYDNYYVYYMFWAICFVAIYERKKQLIIQR